MVAKKPKAIGLKKALDLMHRTGTRLVMMSTTVSPEGFAYYLVPGGYVEPETAERIIKHPNVLANEDGLFPGHSQTWMLKTSGQQ